MFNCAPIPGFPRRCRSCDDATPGSRNFPHPRNSYSLSRDCWHRCQARYFYIISEVSLLLHVLIFPPITAEQHWIGAEIHTVAHPSLAARSHQEYASPSLCGNMTVHWKLDISRFEYISPNFSSVYYRIYMCILKSTKGYVPIFISCRKFHFIQKFQKLTFSL